MKQSVARQLWTLLAPMLESEGKELVDVEYKKEGKNWILRIFVDKEGGITLEDCSSLSRLISPILDVEDCIPRHYMLEVSSPGLDRPLNRLNDYRRFKGRLVRITTYAPIGGRKKYLGRITGVDGETILLNIEAENRSVSVPFGDIARGRLEVEL